MDVTRTLTVKELSPFGVELELDLRQELDPAEQEELRRLYGLHDLVVVKGPVLTMDQQIRAVGYLGPVLRTPDSVGEISRTSPIGLGGAELCFHSDYVYSPEPLWGISLHAVDVVDGETSTRFASGRVAYQALDPELRQRIATLSSLQVFGAALDRRNRHAEVDALPSTVHPLVWPHEGTGTSFLLAPEMTTDSIVGLEATESETLVQRLFTAMYGPSRISEHRWSLGDLVVWNNVSVMHARGDYSDVEHRVLQRAAIGTKGYYQLYPEMAAELDTSRWG